jgi:hypothetical protein
LIHMQIGRKKEVDLLKLISILLPILLAMSGVIYHYYEQSKEPDFSNSKYYTTAWIEYGVNQNTLNIEFVPDLHGAVFPAIGEALKRVDVKSEGNPKIDDKPILIITYVRDKTKLVEAARVIVTRKEIDIVDHGTFEERQAVISEIRTKAETSFNESHIMVQRPDGRFEFVPVKNDTFDSDKVYGNFITDVAPEGITYA